ncbi:RadC family protein [Rhodovibrionaceae bacterium A322]
MAGSDTQADKATAQDGQAMKSGHRARLRARLLDRGGGALADYELLETLLFAAHARKDTKPIAKALLKRFGSLARVFNASDQDLLSVDGMGQSSLASFRLTQEIARRFTLEEAKGQSVLNSWDKLLAYCRVQLAHEQVENFHLLFLDQKNHLIADERQQRGTVNHTPVYPREVIKRALELNATALILVHNHPSGDPTPSKADIAMTREIKAAAEKLSIQIHDHLIIGKKGHSSFKSLGLL